MHIAVYIIFVNRLHNVATRNRDRDWRGVIFYLRLEV